MFRIRIIETVVDVVKRKIDPYYDWDDMDQTYDPDDEDDE